MTAVVDDGGFRVDSSSTATAGSDSSNPSVNLLKRGSNESNDFSSSQGCLIVNQTGSPDCAKRSRDIDDQEVLDLTINSSLGPVNGSKPSSAHDPDTTGVLFYSKSPSSTPSPQSSSSSQTNFTSFVMGKGMDQTQQSTWCTTPQPAHTAKLCSPVPIPQGNLFPTSCLAPVDFNALMQHHMGVNAAAVAAAAASLNLFGATPWARRRVRSQVPIFFVVRGNKTSEKPVLERVNRGLIVTRATSKKMASSITSLVHSEKKLAEDIC
ncbi:hypothetical protein X801_05855 [Opisthorchis viverrini]|uniref:Uncharacterized protein n=2 Tax=Opisthorchis viverrini TaxID=6198 RepID=A0A1S8WV06_OPIVI|nr:hypothetical protein T265_10625 [Opisthorchis viverrini]KER20938.1 hypothetical protein T265_10625 [Opisthorchis viverrini]OON18294.1 hypothetical protein X801_05855 [Opisthorchis viverrini]